MRLLDLEPRWLNHAGKNIAILFQCPHCHVAGKRQWLTCFFVPAGSIPKAQWDSADGDYYDAGDRILFANAFVEMGMDRKAAQTAAHQVVGCKPSIAWTRQGHDFATISITPSLDASGAGHWHGHITNGEIVGGI